MSDDARKPLLSAQDWATPAPSHQVTLLTRPGCHLCDEARPGVQQACRDTGSQYQELDLTSDPQLEAEYRNDIPVVFVDGVAWDRLRIDPARLRAVLS